MTEMGSVCRSTKSSSFNIHSCGSLCANLSMKVLSFFFFFFFSRYIFLKIVSLNFSIFKINSKNNEKEKETGFRFIKTSILRRKNFTRRYVPRRLAASRVLRSLKR